MAALERLEVHRFRNLHHVEIEAAPGINIISGDNGSGKTSLLEAIYFLGLGRSFRSTKVDSVVEDGQDDSLLRARLAGGGSVGLLRPRRQAPLLKLQGERQRSWTEVARELPLQLINADTFQLLDGSPKARRRFLDWGVFHVEHHFISAWRKATRSLAQRNLLLKQDRPDRAQLDAWSHELAAAAVTVDLARRDYFRSFVPVAELLLAELIQIPGLSLGYWRGWEEEADYLEVLRSSLERDLRYSATQAGPHRADLIIKIEHRPAAEVLSRGQQKLLVSALKIAQGHLLSQRSSKKGIYLVDDLPSELDRRNRGRVCGLLSEMKCQVFLTAVDAKDLELPASSSEMLRKFHVEHGKIAAVAEH